MKKKSFSFIFSIILLFIVSISSCTEDWDKHYSPVSEQKSDLNLYEYISRDSSLSSFTKMLKVAGYDTILNKPQTYTVWAPENSAFPTGSDLDAFLKDTTKVIEIVENHIAHFSYTTSGLTSKKVYILANKIVKFEFNGTDFTFGGQKISKLNINIGTSNGIIHYINNYVTYVKNIWEFIDKTDGLDSLKAFLYANTKKIFNLAGSGHDIGIDKNGQLLYDSAFIITNKIFSRIGYINLEDSIYTAILPKNNAWTEEYKRIYPYFNTLEKDGGAAKQRENTQFAIVQDLVFRKPQNNPGSLDSLVSTSGNVIYKPGYLFEGSPSEASNGLVYINNSLHNKDTNTWHKEIRFEAESLPSYDLTNKANYDLFYNTTYGSELNISKNEYLFAKKMDVSDLFASYVKFSINNTLSAKYKIYCVFVPASIDDSTNLFPSKVKFYLTYVNSAGKLITDAPIDNTNVVQAPGKTNGIFLTDPTKMDKMFVTEFQFPYCNMYDPTSYESMISYVSTVKLRVENAAKKAEGKDSSDGKTKKTVNLDLRIDCIILEPVQ